MKEERALLGLTQQEMAMILKVSRSQYSLHEMGIRNLPSGAGLRLGEMVLYMHSPEAKVLPKLPKSEHADGKTKRVLEKRLEENEFQLLVLTRKIDTALEKFDKQEKAVILMGFLNSPEEAKKAAAPEILSSIEERAIMNFRKTKSELSLLQIDFFHCCDKKIPMNRDNYVLQK